MTSRSALFAFFLTFTTTVARADDPTAAIHAYFTAQGNAAQRVYCIELEGLRIDELHVDGDAASARVTTSATKRERATPRVRTTDLNIYSVVLAKENGAWCVSQAPPAVDALADALITNDARNALLARNLELMSPELVRALIRRAYALVVTPKKLHDAGRAGELAEDVASQIGDAGGVALGLGVRSVVANLEGRREEARAEATEAVAMARSADDPEALARALIAVARTYDNEPGGPLRPQLLREAASLEDRVEDLSVIARAYSAMKHDEWRTDNWVALRRWLDEEFRLATLAGDVTEMTNADLGLAAVYGSLGDPDACIQYAQRAAENERVHPTTLYATAHLLESHCRRLRGDRDGVREVIEEALRWAREVGNLPLTEANALMELAQLDLDDRDYDAAEQHVRESLAILNARDYPSDAHYILLARIELARGRYAGVLEATRAFRASSASRPHTVISKTFDAIAHRALGDVDAALADVDAAMAASEELNARLFGDDRQRAAALRGTVDPFVEAVDLNVELGRVDTALACAERGRGRILLESVSSGPHRVGTSMTAEERETGERLERNLATLNREMLDVKAGAAASERLARARVEYETFRAALYVRHPELKTRRGAVPVASVPQILEALPEQAAFLEYVVGENRTQLFAVSRAGVRVHTLPIGRGALEAKVTAYRKQLALRALSQRSSARALDKILLAPVEDLLQAKHVIGIVADGALWQVPFEALVDARGRYRVETHSIFYAPSISIFLEMHRAASHREDRARPRLLAVGDPAVSDTVRRTLHDVYRSIGLSPLPEAKVEVERLRSIYGSDASTVYVGAAATESRVKAEIGHRQIVHFATHGILDDTNPMYSRLVLAQAKNATGSDADGLLEAWELMDLDLEADLVVLSSCDSARGLHSAGEGMIGMTWAAFVAGARTTVASLWKVSSKSTSALMVDFHRELHDRPAGDMAKAEALRRAKLRMLRSKGRTHPFYWAAFVVIGDPE